MKRCALSLEVTSEDETTNNPRLPTLRLDDTSTITRSRDLGELARARGVVRIVSWNIWFDDSLKAERAEVCLDILTSVHDTIVTTVVQALAMRCLALDADVIALQEVTQEAREVVERVWGAHGAYQHSTVHLLDLKRVWRGDLFARAAGRRSSRVLQPFKHGPKAHTRGHP